VFNALNSVELAFSVAFKSDFCIDKYKYVACNADNAYNYGQKNFIIQGEILIAGLLNGSEVRDAILNQGKTANKKQLIFRAT